ncbi:hypothetical protein TorRG33x02_012910 [Trema orientale]|uniref:Uncharacterized protein n=1 Tax=Trema orientale TaxID=63057 RepID=A0A2P5FZJ8_TREOI|nr:hypothetical protein TorRG33x02_012910 [Trema orientale]
MAVARHYPPPAVRNPVVPNPSVPNPSVPLFSDAIAVTTLPKKTTCIISTAPLPETPSLPLHGTIPFGPALSPVADNTSRPLSVLDSNCISGVTTATSSSAFVAGHASYFASTSAVKSKAKLQSKNVPPIVNFKRDFKAIDSTMRQVFKCLKKSDTSTTSSTLLVAVALQPRQEP